MNAVSYVIGRVVYIHTQCLQMTSPGILLFLCGGFTSTSNGLWYSFLSVSLGSQLKDDLILFITQILLKLIFSISTKAMVSIKNHR